ncbi:MAG: hypothetical protein PHE26_08755 [Syntrophomonadaceae bacterium]|nr:hypothetical protein [Syntrophomonadaceae bacterium]
MEIEINLDELIKDINESKLAEEAVYLCTGVGLGVREGNFENLRVEKDDEGNISLGIDLDQRLVTPDTEIYKSEDAAEPGKASYEIREDGMLLLIMNLYK